MNSALRWFTLILTILALAAGFALLASDAKFGVYPGISAAITSAAPLLLIGVSFLVFQPLIRPNLVDLTKNVLLAATFILWGIIQLMPQTTLSLRLGDLVIVLYVVDLAWMILARIVTKQRQSN
jgi:hypothetical protein